MILIDGIGIGPQMREHVVTGARSALVPERGDVDRRHDNPLAGTGRCLREHAAVEVHDL